MSERILLTGGAGYLGSVMCERFLNTGYAVTVLDNLLYHQESLLHVCTHPGFSFVRGDVRDRDLMERMINEHDILVPLAAIVGVPACDQDPHLAQSVNLDAVRMMNKLSSPNQLVVFPVTNSGYGTKSGDLHCTEQTPLEPISLYGQTKVQAEQELLSGGNAVTLRLATVFGVSPRMRLDLLVNHFTYVAVTDGYIVIFEQHFKRNFIHIRDVADCFLHAITHRQDMVGQPFNVGLDSANISKQDLAEAIRTQVPRFHIEYSGIGRDPDQRNYIVSNQKLRQAGFEAAVSLEQGIQELIKAYRMLGRSRYKNA